MPPVFFFALLLPQRKLTLPLQFPLRFGANLPGSSPLLPLHVERLLGLSANTGLLELFRISRCTRLGFTRRSTRCSLGRGGLNFSS